MEASAVLFRVSALDPALERTEELLRIRLPEREAIVR
jgi:hypothetical protein